MLCIHTFLNSLHTLIPALSMSLYCLLCAVWGVNMQTALNASLTTSASGFKDSITIFAKSDLHDSNKSHWQDKCNCNFGLMNYLKTNHTWLWSLGSVHPQERHRSHFHDSLHILSGNETNHTQNQTQTHTHCAKNNISPLGNDSNRLENNGQTFQTAGYNKVHSHKP